MTPRFTIARSPAAVAASGFTIITVDPTTDARWSQLQRSPAAGLFHSPPWLRVLADAYAFKPQAYLAIDDTGSLRGGIAFCVISDALGSRLVSLPFSDAADPLLMSPTAWPPLLASLIEHGMPIQLRCLHESTVATDPLLTTTKRARWHTLAITADSDALWSGIESSSRRAIRCAQRNGVEVRPLLGFAAVNQFRDLHVKLRKYKYGLLAQPLAFFSALARRFDECGGWFPLGAFLGERLLAVTIYLRWGATLYYKFNASSLDALSFRPNNLLAWAGILLARSLGCSTLDFGPSDEDQPGLIRFKRQFGAAEREVQFLQYASPEWRDDRGTELRRTLTELTGLLTGPEIPDVVTARAGELLYRLFA